MSKVIGGEYSINVNEYMDIHSYYNQEELFSSGRAALHAILNDIKISLPKRYGRILLPNYLCDSITRTVKDAGWKYNFYRIDSKLYPIENDIINNPSYNIVLLINYFGMIDLSGILNYIRSHRSEMVIIVDNVQGYYAMDNCIGDYYFTSFRKWFPCPDGAIAKKYNGTDILNLQMSENEFAQYKFAANILKNFNSEISDKLILEFINRGEELLDKRYLCRCSDITRKIVCKIDYMLVSEVRKRNADILHKGLLELGIEHIYDDKCVPLFVPIFLKNRDEVRRRMFSNNIFTPIHWPWINFEINGNSDLYKTELSLICDQRYGVEDMKMQLNLLSSV